ncbi:MAG: hypothetical protein GTO63_36590, partial [Anaerolineae bacterium]|nr:hypothetical protein [Anaerolineae bacterium]NIO00275.1 hypothetical protein [Anaerolineae bacterium]NIQ83056.1 hypothetical protein [Anaerolineae bacterium]
MATGGPDPTRVALGPPTHERRGPWLKGRQVVDGEECVVVEVAYVHTAEEGGEISLNDTFWISPRMGFATLKMETRCYGGKYGDEGMLSAEVTTQTREWGDG